MKHVGTRTMKHVSIRTVEVVADLGFFWSLGELTDHQLLVTIGEGSNDLAVQ